MCCMRLANGEGWRWTNNIVRKHQWTSCMTKMKKNERVKKKHRIKVWQYNRVGAAHIQTNSQFDCTFVWPMTNLPESMRIHLFTTTTTSTHTKPICQPFRSWFVIGHCYLRSLTHTIPRSETSDSGNRYPLIGVCVCDLFRFHYSDVTLDSID